jgi:hypothetical protein
MPSKSQLFGQSDIWDLSDYFGGTGPWETSLKWYTPGVTLTSTPYPLDDIEIYKVTPALEFLELRILQHDVVYNEDYKITPALTYIEVRDTNKYLNAPDEFYKVIPSMVEITLVIPLKTIAPVENYKVTPSMTAITVAIKLVSVSATEVYKVTPSMEAITVTTP